MQMLAAGGLPPLTDAVRSPDADNPRGYFEYEPVKRLRDDARCLEAAVGKAVKVIHALATAIPGDLDVRAIVMRRDLEAVVASQQRMLGRRGAPSGDLPADRLVEIFRAQLEEATRWLESQPRFAVLELDYDGLLDDPVAAANALADFLGGGLDVAAMAAAVDPALRHHRLESGDESPR